MIDRTSAGSWASSVARLANLGSTPHFLHRKELKEIVAHRTTSRLPIIMAGLVVEGEQIDTVGGGELSTTRLAHLAPTGIGEDAERHAFCLVGRDRCEHRTRH